MRKLISLYLILCMGGSGRGELIAKSPPQPVPKIAKPAANLVQQAPLSTVASRGPSSESSKDEIQARVNAAPLVANALDDVILGHGPSALRLAEAAVVGQALQTKESAAPASPLEAPKTAVSGAEGPSTLRGWIAEALLHASPLDMAILGGAQTFVVDGHSWTAPAVAIRVRPDTSRWSAEVGAVTPQATPGDFRTAEASFANIAYQARVGSLYEIHVIGEYAFYKSHRSLMSADIGFGVSMLHVTSEIKVTTMNSFPWNGTLYSYPSTTVHEVRRFAFSPLLRLGVNLFPEHFFSGRVDIAYVGYGNTVSPEGFAVDLGMSGWMIREMVACRF